MTEQKQEQKVQWTEPLEFKKPVIVKVDWPAIIADLKEVGLSRYRLAKLLEVSEGAIRNWEKGGGTRYECGAALLKLYMEHVAVKTNPIAEDAQEA
jgi:hypothetical protein